MATRTKGAEALEKYLSEKNLSQTAFAERLGVDRVQLWRWITGERTPRIEALVEIERQTDGAIAPALWAEAAA